MSGTLRQALEASARAIARGALLVAVCAPLSLADEARAEEGGVDPPPSSLAAFDELYARLTTAGEGGGPTPDIAAPAEDLRFALRTALIRSDAEIEVLKLEAARFTGERQAEALNGLVRAAAARERSLWLAIRQLERLAGGLPVPLPVAEPAGEEEATSGGLQLSFEPQDVLEEPDP